MGDLSGPLGAVLGGDLDGDVLAGGKVLQAEDGDLIGGVDLLVVSTVDEVERQETLLLQVSLVDSSKRLGDDGETTEESGLKSSVLSRRSLTKVITSNDNPSDTVVSVSNGSLGNSAPLASDLVSDVVGLLVLSVDGSNHVVVGDVLEMASVLEPRTSLGDMVGGGLTERLDEDGHVDTVLAVPRLEGLEQLESVGSGRHIDNNLSSVSGRGLVGVHAGVVTSVGKTLSGGLLELELLSVRVLEGVGQGVESQVTGNGESGDEIGRGDESVSLGVRIVSASEVSVVRRNNGVLLALLDVSSIPLSDTGATSVGKHDTAKVKEGLQLSVSLNGGSDLLGTGGDGVDGLGLEAVGHGILGNGGGSLHILVRGVGARADKTDLDLKGPSVLDGDILELGDGGGKIGGEGTVDVRLESVEVNLDELVVLTSLISLEVVVVESREVSNLLSASGVQVVGHSLVEGEGGGGSTNLGTHVTDGTHTGTRQVVNTLAEVLDDGTGSTLDGEDTGDLKNDILGGRPSGELTGQLDTDNLGGLELPGETGHDVDDISTSDTDGEHTETSSVGGMGVGTDEKSTGEGVVLENDLMDNTRSGLPETNVVLGGGGAKEVVDLLVDVDGSSKIGLATNLGLNQMITVDGGGGLDGGDTGRHELEDGHLGGGILAGSSVGSQLEVRLSSDNLLLMGLVEMAVENLLGVGQGSVESLLDNLNVLVVLLEVDEVVGLPVGHSDLGVEVKRRIGGGRERSCKAGLRVSIISRGLIG